MDRALSSPEPTLVVAVVGCHRTTRLTSRLRGGPLAPWLKARRRSALPSISLRIAALAQGAHRHAARRSSRSMLCACMGPRAAQVGAGLDGGRLDGPAEGARRRRTEAEASEAHVQRVLALKQAIRDLHGAASDFVDAVSVDATRRARGTVDVAKLWSPLRTTCTTLGPTRSCWRCTRRTGPTPRRRCRSCPHRCRSPFRRRCRHSRLRTRTRRTRTWCTRWRRPLPRACSCASTRLRPSPASGTARGSSARPCAFPSVRRAPSVPLVPKANADGCSSQSACIRPGVRRRIDGSARRRRPSSLG